MKGQDCAPLSLLPSPRVSVGLGTQPRQGWQGEGATSALRSQGSNFKK